MSSVDMSVITALLLALSGAAAGADELPAAARDVGKTAGKETVGAYSPLPEGNRPAARAGRLRFRNGPVCMCAGGLGEAEIDAASRLRDARRD